MIPSFLQPCGLVLPVDYLVPGFPDLRAQGVRLREFALPPAPVAAKREIVALNKIDLVPREDLDQVRRQFASRIGVPAASVRLVSGATGAG